MEIQDFKNAKNQRNVWCGIDKMPYKYCALLGLNDRA